MSKINITDKGKKILESILSESKKSPFFKDTNDGKMYFKYNQITIENQSGFWKDDGIIINYLWDGVPLFEQRANGIKFEPSTKLTLEGIEGRIGIDFNFMQG